MSLELVIREALNEYNAEAGSNTPDYILARYLMACLNAFDHATKERARWAGQQVHVPLVNANAQSIGDASVLASGNTT